MGYLPLPGDDPKQRRPDITRARKYLGWEPKTQLREGLLKTIDYFRRLDLRQFKKPTPHTAHKNTEDDKAVSNLKKLCERRGPFAATRLRCHFVELQCGRLASSAT